MKFNADTARVIGFVLVMVFVSMIAPYVKFNRKQSKYINENKWVRSLAVFCVAYFAMEVASPTTSYINKLLVSGAILAVFEIVLLL